MSPTLLLPAALAALVALVIPLVIHLARRSETRPTDFAALRWLDPRPRPRSRLRFDEWPLLVARLVLLALVPLWLARPALFGAADTTPWVAVVPGADSAGIPAGGARHWLAPGFPALDRPRPVGPVAVASLLRQLDAELPAGVALTVVVPAVIDGADAERPRLSRAVTWRVVPGAMPAAGAVPQPIPGLTIRYAPERAAALRYLRAAATAWQPAGHAPDFTAAPASVPLPAVGGNLVWLAPGPLPAALGDWIRRGGTALLDAGVTGLPTPATVAWHDDVGLPLVTAAALGRGRVLRLTRPLDPAAMPQLLEPDFPARLRALFAAPPAPPTRVAAAAYAPLTGGAVYSQPARDLRPWLALVVAAMLLIERGLATTRRSRDAA